MRRRLSWKRPSLKWEETSWWDRGPTMQAFKHCIDRGSPKVGRLWEVWQWTTIQNRLMRICLSALQSMARLQRDIIWCASRPFTACTDFLTGLWYCRKVCKPDGNCIRAQEQHHCPSRPVSNLDAIVLDTQFETPRKCRKTCFFGNSCLAAVPAS
jgi:hypothetical protein